MNDIAFYGTISLRIVFIQSARSEPNCSPCINKFDQPLCRPRTAAYNKHLVKDWLRSLQNWGNSWTRGKMFILIYFKSPWPWPWWCHLMPTICDAGHDGKYFDKVGLKLLQKCESSYTETNFYSNSIFKPQWPWP